MVAGSVEIVRTLRSVALLLLAALPGIARPAEQSPAALNGFEDAIRHWRNAHGDKYLRYAPEQVAQFELPSIVAQESVGVVRYLMSIPDPSPAIVAAVDGTADWFGRVEIAGWKIETFDVPLEQYRYHASNKDRRLVRDPAASGLWARFYDLQDNSVVLATRERTNA